MMSMLKAWRRIQEKNIGISCHSCDYSMPQVTFFRSECVPEDGQRMWTPRTTKSQDSTVFLFHQGPTPGDFPRSECNMAPSFCSHLLLLINLPIYQNSSPTFCPLSHADVAARFAFFLCNFRDLCFTVKYLLHSILGETLKCDTGFITYFMTTKSAGLIKHSRVFSLHLFFFGYWGICVHTA